MYTPISTDNYLGSVILLPSISIAPIWIASVWDDTHKSSFLLIDNYSNNLYNKFIMT